MTRHTPPGDQNPTQSSAPESSQITTTTFAVPRPVQKSSNSQLVSKAETLVTKDGSAQVVAGSPKPTTDSPMLFDSIVRLEDTAKNIRPKLTPYYAAKSKESKNGKEKQDAAAASTLHVEKGNGFSLASEKLEANSAAGSSSKPNSDDYKQNILPQQSLKRPFACDLCSRSFMHKHLLEKHKEKHSEVTDHQCSVCLSYFSTGSKLKEHTINLCLNASNTSKELLACAYPGCFYNTLCVDELTNHVLTHGLPRMTSAEFARRYGPTLCNFYVTEKANGNKNI